MRPLDQALRTYRTASVMSGKSYASVVKGQSSNKANIKRLVPDVAGTDKHMSASRNSINLATGKENKHGLQCKTLDTCVNKRLQVQETDTLQNIQGKVGETTKPKVEVNNSHQLDSVKSGDSTVVHIFYINASDNGTFLHSLLHNKTTRDVQNIIDCQILERCKQQSHMKFGFIPLSDPMASTVSHSNPNNNMSLLQLHSEVKNHGKPNFLGARIPVASELNIPKWKTTFSDYWDKQLIFGVWLSSWF